MDYKEYKQMVIESENGSLTDYPKILHALMGMNGESGECIDILKKRMFQGHELDVDHLLNELGDVCWYTMLLIIELDIEPVFVFEYLDRLIHVRQWKEKPEDNGLAGLLCLNLYCGKAIDVYYNSIGKPTITMLGTLRSIFYNIKTVANIFDKTLEDIFDVNCNKIKKRYPDGFDPDMSINRSENKSKKFQLKDSDGESKGYVYYE